MQRPYPRNTHPPISRSKVLQKAKRVNPLSPNSDENEISLYIINTYSNNQVMRIKKVIVKDKMS